MSDYSEFFLNSRASIVQLELLEISHPSFTTTYRLVRNNQAGVVVTLEDSSTGVFEYRPLQITSMGSRDDLDQAYKIDLGDLGAVLPMELDRVEADNAFDTKPTVIYRTYRSDDLTQPLFGPVALEIDDFAFKAEGSSFVARAPQLNNSTTGEFYKLDRFPMLRGFL